MLNDPSSRTRARLMREALVDAKVGLSQSRAARDAASAQLERERTELATVRRRGQNARYRANRSRDSPAKRGEPVDVQAQSA